MHLDWVHVEEEAGNLWGGREEEDAVVEGGTAQGAALTLYSCRRNMAGLSQLVSALY